MVTDSTAPDRIYRAVSDPTRRAILDLLRREDATTGQLAGCFPVSRPAISKHLRLLREASLVDERREGRHRVYSLRAEPLAEIDAWLGRYRLFWSAGGASVDTISPEGPLSGSECDTAPR